MGKVKELLFSIRDGLAYSFSWLVICSIIVSLIGGNEVISVSYLLKVFVLCFWAVISFVICFKTNKIQKKGFIFSLTLFYFLFIPVEVLLFYAMGIFRGNGSAVVWIVFGAIVIFSYLLSLFIDRFVMKKDAEEYTRKILDYTSKNSGQGE